jgi:hypothetical protein
MASSALFMSDCTDLQLPDADCFMCCCTADWDAKELTAQPSAKTCMRATHHIKNENVVIKFKSKYRASMSTFFCTSKGLVQCAVEVHQLEPPRTALPPVPALLSHDELLVWDK